MSNEQDKRDPNDHLGRELRQLLRMIEEAPVPDELRDMAKKVENALKEQKRDGKPD